MLNSILRVLCIGLLALWIFPLPTVLAAPDILPVDQIQTGMMGIGKTVIAGTKIEEFNVEVLGVMKGKGPQGDLILVRTSGDVIDRAGGIAEGMSGSPVYIQGKLIGAIAYGWPLADHRVGMVTPIADMLKNFSLPDKAAEPQIGPEAGSDAESAADADSAAAATTAQAAAEKSDVPVPLTTPLMVSGYSQSALQYLTGKIAPLHLTPFLVGDAPANAVYGNIEPGSSIGVQLVRGDVTIGALGTVTYVDGNKILAFGHPFLQKGAVDYFATNAYIFTTVQGLESSFKVGTTGDLVGTINQDRGTGIAGELQQYPYVIPFRVTVTDKDLNQTLDSTYQVVQDEELAPILGATGVYNTIQKAMDREGGGTAKVSFEITGRNMPGEVLKRDNLFYASDKIGELAVNEVHEALAMLTTNIFSPVDLFDVKVNVSVDSSRRTATVMSAKVVGDNTAKPGDKVAVAVTLKPYRGKSFVKNVTYQVPKNQPIGPVVLEVRGGGMVPLAQILLKRQGIDLDALRPANKQRTFKDIVDNFTNREHNNDIVVEVLDTSANGENGEGTVPIKGKKPVKSLSAAAGGQGDNKTPHDFTSTDFVIDGDTQTLINVVS